MSETSAIDSGVVEDTTSETIETNTETNTETSETNTNAETVESWYSGEEYSDIASKYDNVDGVLKELTNAQSLIGKKGVIRPADDAPAEDWNKYYTDLGKPVDANDYNFVEITDETPDWIKETDATFREMAFNSNLTSEQAKAVFDNYVDMQTQLQQARMEEAKVSRDAGIAEIKAEYGEEYQKVFDMAKKVADDAGILDTLKYSELGNNPAILKLLADYGNLKGIALTTPNIDSDLNIPVGGTFEEKVANLRTKRDSFEYKSDDWEKIQKKIVKMYM